jgi:hypothetical protein
VRNDDLTVDPGPAFEPSEQAKPEDERPLAERLAETAVEWETEVIADLVAVPFLPLWLLAKRAGGPPGCFLPDERQARSIARPLTRMLNKSERLRRWARLQDPVALLAAVGTFLKQEASEFDDWRKGQTPATAPPDVDVVDVGVSAFPAGNAAAADRAAAGREQVRRWRPPQIEPEPAS